MHLYPFLKSACPLILIFACRLLLLFCLLVMDLIFSFSMFCACKRIVEMEGESFYTFSSSSLWLFGSKNKWISLIIELCMCTQSYLTLGDPIDCSLPGSSVHGIFQARILKQVAISFSRGSSWPGDETSVSCIPCPLAGGFFTSMSPGKHHSWVSSLCVCFYVFILMEITTGFKYFEIESKFSFR